MGINYQNYYPTTFPSLLDAKVGQPTGYVTIPNPNKNETNKRFIKVKYQDYYHKGQDYKQASRGFIVGVKSDG